MITPEQKAIAARALRVYGFNPNETRELLAGPKGLRDEFAGQAMAQLVPQADVTSGGDRVEIARLSYLIADAMMAQRGEPC